MDKKVAVVGLGQTLHSIMPRKSWRSLMVEAVNEALDSAGITIDDIDEGYLSMGSPEHTGQNHPAGIANWELGLCGKKGLIHVENACASGTSALKVAWLTILSGKADIVLVTGVDKTTDNIRQFESVGAHSDVEWEYNFGLSWGPIAALTKRLHMQKYGSTDREFLAYPVVAHEYAVKNPKCSQFGKAPMSLDIAEATPATFGPVRIAEFCLQTDGACALILASEDKAKELTDKPVYIEHIANCSNPQLIGNKWTWGGDDILVGKGGYKAIKELYEVTKLKPDDMDIAEVHDSISVAAPVLLEALGIFEKGKGPRKILEGETRIDGECPTGTMGGFKWMGHPIGVSGLNQVHELTLQLRGEAGERQVANPEFGIFANEGGNGVSFFAGILGRRG